MVLASMGGQPTRPEVRLAEEKRKQQNADGEQGGSNSSGFSESGDGMRSREGFKDEEEKEIEGERERMRKERGVQPTEWTGHD